MEKQDKANMIFWGKLFKYLANKSLEYFRQSNGQEIGEKL